MRDPSKTDNNVNPHIERDKREKCLKGIKKQ